MIFKRFDYQHPPINGMYWIEFSIPETDCDADDNGAVSYTHLRAHET